MIYLSIAYPVFGSGKAENIYNMYIILLLEMQEGVVNTAVIWVIYMYVCIYLIGHLCTFKHRSKEISAVRYCRPTNHLTSASITVNLFGGHET